MTENKSENSEEKARELKIQRFSRLLLENPNQMTKEQDLKNLCENEDEFDEILPEIVARFNKLGISLVRTVFHQEKYFVLTSPGKDDKVSPSMYGILGLLAATFNSLGANLSLNQLKDLFHEVWNDIEQLVTVHYLEIVSNGTTETLEITPIGKAALKNILKGFDLKEFIKLEEAKNELSK